VAGFRAIGKRQLCYADAIHKRPNHHVARALANLLLNMEPFARDHGRDSDALPGRGTAERLRKINLASALKINRDCG